MGSSETILSKGMIIGTHEVLRGAGHTTLTKKELLLQTRVDPQTMEKILQKLR